MSSTEETNGGSLPYVWLLTVVAALGGLLFGFDTAVISGAIGFLTSCFHLDPAFGKGWAAAQRPVGVCRRRRGGRLLQRPPGAQADADPRRVPLLVSAIGTALPRSEAVFVVFRLMAGVAIGAASISSPMYIAEVSPARMRGKMVSVNQLAIVSGILIAYFVNYFIAAYGTAVDRGVVMEQMGSPGDPLTQEAAEAFIARHGRQIDRHRVEKFIFSRTRAFAGAEGRQPRRRQPGGDPQIPH